MNNHSDKNKLESDELDELVLDRLVDNDLSEEEYREVLRLVEQKPNGWQKLALAFLESQALENDLNALQWNAGADSDATGAHFLALDPASQANRVFDADVGDPSSNNDVQNNDVHDKEAQNAQGNEEPSVEQRSPLSQKEDTQESNTAKSNPQSIRSNLWNNFRIAFPAIAACFAIAFIAGLYVRELQEKSKPRIVNVGEWDQSADGNRSDNNYLEVVSKENSDRVKTPVLNHKQFDPASFRQNIDNLKPKLQQVVNQSGFRANEKNHMVPIEDRSGNRMIVPLKEIQLSPNKFEDFQ